MSKLIIAEKPSVARDIGKVLGATKRGEGYIFNDDYIVSWAIGHLVTLLDPEDYDTTLKKWNINTLPIIPDKIKLKPVVNTKKQFTILNNLINDKKIDEIICATDSGREGELIFRYIYDLSGSTKPFKRLWISSMTDTAIKEGFSKLKDGSEYDNLYQSAKCRSEADWLVGINATRAYTIRYNALLSIGRVQTPTLAIIVNRQKEIDNFLIEDYFEIKALFDGYSGKWINNEKETKILNLEIAKKIIESCTGKDGVVSSIESEKKQIPPPLLFDLTELQRECNKKFGYSATKTLGIVQDLYEKKKYVTYPRTDSRYLSNDMIPKLKGIVSKLNIEPYCKYVNYVSTLEKLPITKRIIDDTKITDHHAIIPTFTNFNINSLSVDEKKVFDLIAKRFLSVFYPKYEYNTTTLITKIENENFISKGTTILKLGWKEVISDENKNDDEEILPDVKKGQIINVIDLIIEKKKTKPPKAYTEGTLLSAMENAGKFVDDENLKEHLKESGIGTPATRAAIIERLLTVGYIIRNKKNLSPTEKGIKLIEVLPDELTSPETTGKWEKGLSSISKGKMDSEKFMSSIQKYVNYIISSSKNSKKNVTFPSENRNFKDNPNFKSFGDCPICSNGKILENSKSFYCTNWKNGCKFSIWKNFLEKQEINIDSNFITELLKNKKVEIVKSNNQTCSITLDLKINGMLDIKNSQVSQNKSEVSVDE